MFHRFHGGKRKGNSSGKWQRVPRGGVGTVLAETEGDWQITITHRQTGTTIRRDVYSALIRSITTNKEEFLTGFASKTSAMAAARRRLAMLDSLKKRRDMRRLWRAP